MDNTCLTGRCACGEVRFRLESAPIITNACHCRFCQRAGGSAFAVNTIIEADRVTLTGEGAPVSGHESTALPEGQVGYRCPTCKTLLWTNHAMIGPALALIRIGVLDEAERLAPDLHCFTATKHPWVAIPDGVPAYEGLPPQGAGMGLEAIARFGAALGG